MQKKVMGTVVKGIDGSRWLQLEKLEQELNRSSDLAGLLFTDGVILVEGETEIDALREWFPKSAVGQGKTFSDLNLALSWVGGKTGFAFSMHFLNEFGIPWVAICDGDALDPQKNKPLWNVLKNLQLIDTNSNGTSFEDWKNIAKQAGLYTANASSVENFEDIPEGKRQVERPLT
jgi:predicted ATP-dependent endonuclease of OLD family